MIRRALSVVVVCAIVSACGGSGDGSQEAVKPVTIAFLRAVAGTPSTEPAFVDELRSAGYRKGGNLTILAADSDEAYPDPADARDAVRGWVDQGATLIVALSSGGALAAVEAAPEATVLFLSNDPKAAGLVEDERAPEGRLTGVTFRVPADRTLSLAQRALGTTKLGLAYPPSDPAAIANRDALKAAAAELGIELLTSEFTDAASVDAAVRELAEAGAGALVVSTSPTATRSLREIGAAARTYRLPAVANTSLADFAAVSLYPDSDELGRQLARQAARLLGGASPSAVPVEDPRRFMVTLSTKAAGEVGITIPDAVLQEANNVLR